MIRMVRIGKNYSPITIILNAARPDENHLEIDFHQSNDT